MNQFFVSRYDRSERAAHPHPIPFDEIIGAQPDAPIHRPHFATLTVEVMVLNQNTFVKLLHDRRLRVEVGEGLLDSFFPVGVRQVRSERYTAAAPAKWRKSADLQQNIALFLTKPFRFPPIVDF